MENNPLRLDFKIILDMVKPGATVLDLGCGDGDLMYLLKDQKQCRVTGIELDEKLIYQCIEKGLSVNHGDIDTELTDFSDKRFDYVILNESLQQVYYPKQVILESFRIGKKVIVGIPNFCSLEARLQIMFNGRVPVTKELPFEWFDTPNLRFLSIKDFRDFCDENKIRILKEKGIAKNQVINRFKNLLALNCIFLLEK
ncbi:MAG: methionine biosynthesis protein MetW [Candidatus Omnitrophica bacterium]|nr:methionine biosynthesis protein MetW [Candidatus Omnitrophota bacterium]